MTAPVFDARTQSSPQISESEQAEPMITRSIGRLVDRLHFACAVVGMPVLAIMIAIDVATRYLLRAPFSWSNELEQVILLIVLVGCLPYCTWVGGHVYMDAVYQHLAAPLKRSANVLRSLCGMMFFFSLAYGTLVDLPHYWDTEKATAYLHIRWWLLGGIVGLSGLISGLLLFRRFSRATPNMEHSIAAEEEGI